MPIIQAVANIFLDILTPAIHAITEILGGVIDFLTGVFTGNWNKVWKGIGEIFSGIWDGLVGIVKGVVNGIIDAIDGVIKGVNSIGGAVGIHIGVIPHLAEGATVLPTPGGTVVRVAEAGKPESVVDTGKLNKLLDQAANGGQRKGGGDILPNATIVMQKEHSVAEYAQELGFLQRVYG
jgi:phage-related minor tail protein